VTVSLDNDRDNKRVVACF